MIPLPPPAFAIQQLGDGGEEDGVVVGGVPTEAGDDAEGWWSWGGGWDAMSEGWREMGERRKRGVKDARKDGKWRGSVSRGERGMRVTMMRRQSQSHRLPARAHRKAMNSQAAHHELQFSRTTVCA
jgi:hypothetical protein